MDRRHYESGRRFGYRLHHTWAQSVTRRGGSRRPACAPDGGTGGQSGSGNRPGRGGRNILSHGYAGGGSEYRIFRTDSAGGMAGGGRTAHPSDFGSQRDLAVCGMRILGGICIAVFRYLRADVLGGGTIQRPGESLPGTHSGQAAGFQGNAGDQDSGGPHHRL